MTNVKEIRMNTWPSLSEGEILIKLNSIEETTALFMEITKTIDRFYRPATVVTVTDEDIRRSFNKK
jgi:hypothetical protein